MNEPPISSPLGNSESSASGKHQAAPVLLKTLVLLQLLGSGITFFINIRLTLAHRPDLTASNHPLSIELAMVFVLGLYIVVYAELLWGSKISWLLTQMFHTYSLFLHLRRAFFDGGTAGGVVSPFNFGLSWFVFAVEATLLVYLLSPTMRHFFFARPERT